MTDKADNHREGTDEALVVRYQRGDRTALSILVRRHARSLYSAAYYVIGSEEVATTLTLNVFQQVTEHAGSFHIEMHFRTWVFQFLHQQLQSHCGSEQSDPLSAPSESLTPDSSANALPRLERSQLLSRRVRQSVASLPFAVREMLVLKLVSQLTILELAIATTSTEDAVRDSLRQAMSRIRDAISDTEDYARALR
jgi:RNA polymerase sigma-70 factor (ECF subfamily)